MSSWPSSSTSANAIPASFWNLIEIYNDRKILDRVQDTLAASIVASNNNNNNDTDNATAAEPAAQTKLHFDLTDALSSPLLQSVYAEVLRQRVSLFHNRSPTVGDYKIGPYTLRNGGLVCISTDIAHNSEKAWGPARTDGGRRPLSEFWAERFLVRDDTTTTPGAKEKETGGHEDHDTDMIGAPGFFSFSTEGLDGAWIPYGGGALMCPGRHLAKVKMIGSAAVFAAYFDMELLGGVPRVDDAFFGMGSQPPGEPVPVRLRRKAGAARASQVPRRSGASSVWFCHDQYH
jgi:cytochrome P450